VIEMQHTKSIWVAWISLKLPVLSDGITIVVLNLKNNLYKIIRYLTEEYIRNTLPHYAKATRGTLRTNLTSSFCFIGVVYHAKPRYLSGRSVEMPGNEPGSESRP